MASNGRFLSEHMERLASSVLAQSDRIRAGSRHGGIKGASIEVVLRGVLAQYLPGAFAVGTGQAANVKGALSPQLDVLLYARDIFPHLAVNEDGSVLVCCESVLSVVECKTSWNTVDIAEHFRRFCQVEQARTGGYAREELNSGYFVFIVEKAKPRMTGLHDSARPLGVYSLAGERGWFSPAGGDDFEQFDGNALSFC